MSYFVFGLVLLDERGRTRATSLTEALEDCSRETGISVAFGGLREPRILAEMRGEFDHDAAVPFFCVDETTQDTSQGLVSPVGMAAVARWVDRVLRQPCAGAVQLWVSEGYDDSFERLTSHPGELSVLLLSRLSTAGDLPSLQVTVCRSPKSVHVVMLRNDAFGDTVVGTGRQFAELLRVMDGLRPGLVWYAADVETIGRSPTPRRDPVPVPMGDTKALIDAADGVEQFESGAFAAVPRAVEHPAFREGGLWTDDPDEADLGDALLELRAFDTSFWLVLTNDRELAQQIAGHCWT